MKKAVQAMKIAHGIKKMFSSFKQALKAAWNIIKTGVVTFAKEEGEVRTANVLAFTTINLEKGYAKFTELDKNGFIQYRCFRFERIIL
jgi:hypothetical protein